MGKMSLGERLELALHYLKISQVYASSVTGIPQATISHIIRNKSNSYKKSSQLAEGLQINHDWLVHGRGGILNPTVSYIPVIHEYFRLRLYQAEGVFDETTRFIVSELDYGDGVFGTELNGEVFICSRPPENYEPTDRTLGFLLWSERRKSVITDPGQVQGKRVFLIHEIRHYDGQPEFLK
ncbi:helix-turn-helix transcriptional regulator [Salmonella enterica]|nr:helix-turn-helix transcriptional regulator [Salmonella enterica]ELB5688652.1 helix-turn-helix transcriptional regulator [Salmonella enterica]